MLSLRTLRRFALPLFLTSAITLPAQIVTNSDLPEKPRLEIDPAVANGLQLTWFGREGFSYFLQTTTDLVAEPWQYLPIIETGHNAEIQYGLVAPTPRFFARVVLTEQTAANPMTADFDGDGISNIDELTRMLAPLSNRDDDSDGHPDDWERFYFNNSTTKTNNAFADQDTDGLSDYEEAMRGTDPELEDTDGDGVLDSDDGWPRDGHITDPLLPETTYTRIFLPALGFSGIGALTHRNTLRHADTVISEFDPATGQTTTFDPFDSSPFLTEAGFQGMEYTIYAMTAGNFFPGYDVARGWRRPPSSNAPVQNLDTPFGTGWNGVTFQATLDLGVPVPIFIPQTNRTFPTGDPGRPQLPMQLSAVHAANSNGAAIVIESARWISYDSNGPAAV